MKRFFHYLRDGVLIVTGILAAAFGLKAFLLSSRFIDGGVTGISMLAADLTGTPLALLIFIINLPFIVLGYYQIGLKFAIKGTLAIAGLSLCLFFVNFPDVTPDKLLTAIFGGFFIGAGIGLAIRGGAVLDGTEIAALLISRNSHLLKVGDVILLVNIIIFLAAAFLLGVETAMYSILTYISASKTMQFIIHGVEEYTAVTIISTRNEEIRDAIVHKLKRGVTVLKGSGGAGTTGESSVDAVLYSVVTRLEIGRVKDLAQQIDPSAFITTNSLSGVEGGTVKRAILH